MNRYAAFLRGVNVGTRKVGMGELRKALEDLGYKNVRTLLNSGNVVFDAEEKDKAAMVKSLEEKLEKTFGFPIGVILRTTDEIQSLVESNPFKDVTISPEIRLYVTFLKEKPHTSLKIPYETEEKDFKILKVTDTEVCSVVILSEKRGTTDVMKFLEKEFGIHSTTRNWNTVTKVAAL